MQQVTHQGTTAAEYMPQNQEVTGSNPAWYWLLVGRAAWGVTCLIDDQLIKSNSDPDLTEKFENLEPNKLALARNMDSTHQ